MIASDTTVQNVEVTIEENRMDNVSRQAAIDAINSHFGFNIEEEYGSAVQEVINGLSSAEPEIIRCKDCKNSEHWYADRRRCFLWVEDGISVFDNGFCNYAKRRGNG